MDIEVADCQHAACARKPSTRAQFSTGGQTRHQSWQTKQDILKPDLSATARMHGTRRFLLIARCTTPSLRAKRRPGQRKRKHAVQDAEPRLCRRTGTGYVLSDLLGANTAARAKIMPRLRRCQRCPRRDLSSHRSFHRSSSPWRLPRKQRTLPVPGVGRLACLRRHGVPNA